MAKRRVAILKRISLEGMAEGWTDKCYITVQPASYKEFSEYNKKDIEKLDESQGIALITDMVKKQFVGGQILVLDENGDQMFDAAQIEDLDSLSIEMLTTIFKGIMGVTFDPKAPLTGAENKTQSTTSEVDGEVSLSTTEPTNPTASS